METEGENRKAQVVYLSHGGGPLPILGDPGHVAMIDFMRRLPRDLRRPEAILVISAHWEERVATLQGGATPPMFYDYYGFPEEAYQVKYPAPGSPDLAQAIVDMLNEKNVPAEVERRRGFDHGLFIPLMMMYPEADIPALQISLLGSLDAKAHLDLGRALSGLMTKNVLVVGSGFSFHNLRAFDWRATNARDARNEAFQQWLIETCTGLETREEREQRLVEWESAPSARYCHPREDHLLPLHVCVGMTGTKAKLVFDDYILGKKAVAFLWS
ncbi:MAG TPA: class III extradiol ring-cleavage dioxygenase [Spirochaetia bacterium]